MPASLTYSQQYTICYVAEMVKSPMDHADNETHAEPLKNKVEAKISGVRAKIQAHVSGTLAKLEEHNEDKMDEK